LLKECQTACFTQTLQDLKSIIIATTYNDSDSTIFAGRNYWSNASDAKLIFFDRSNRPGETEIRRRDGHYNWLLVLHLEALPS